MKNPDLKKYKAVILAGGKGTRLYPVTKETPKPLLCVGKKPIINHLVDLFFSAGINDIAVLISSEFRDDFEWWKKRYYPQAHESREHTNLESILQVYCNTGCPNIQFFEEKEPLGTFGGLWYLKDWISDSNFFLSNGDELKEIDLTEMEISHKNRNPVATIALVKVENPQEYGVVMCENGMVEQFWEKPENPPSKYINSGLYLFSPEIFNYHPGPKFLMTEKDIFPKLAAEKKLAGFKFNGKWADCGTWERYSKAIEEWGK